MNAFKNIKHRMLYNTKAFGKAVWEELRKFKNAGPAVVLSLTPVIGKDPMAGSVLGFLAGLPLQPVFVRLLHKTFIDPEKVKLYEDSKSIYVIYTAVSGAMGALGYSFAGPDALKAFSMGVTLSALLAVAELAYTASKQNTRRGGRGG